MSGETFNRRRFAVGPMVTEGEPAPPAMEGRMHGALTDMYAYALMLEAESRRLASGEVREEVVALRDAIGVLRAQAGPLAGTL